MPGRRKEGGGQQEARARLIICRALGPCGHVAGGFCGDTSRCRLSTWPASCHCCCPSLCQEKGLVGPWCCGVTQAGSSGASVGQRGFLLCCGEGSDLWPDGLGFKFWLCHLLGALGVPFDRPAPLHALLCHTFLGAGGLCQLMRESWRPVPTS